MKTLYLIRHGQTEWNVQRRMQGRLDSPLTATGRSQAHASGRTLQAHARLDELIVSPSGRTRETAQIVNAYLHAPISFEEALMERDCGGWSGLTIDEIEATYPRSSEERSADPYHHRPPGGENFEDMIERARGFLDSLPGRNCNEIGLVTHGAMSRAILVYLLGVGPAEIARVRHPNDLVYRLQFHPQRIEASHFLGGQGPHEGLLRHTDNETISRLDGSDDSGGSNP